MVRRPATVIGMQATLVRNGGRSAAIDRVGAHPRLRLRHWFADETRADMTPVCRKRFMNYGPTRAKLRSGGADARWLGQRRTHRVGRRHLDWRAAQNTPLLVKLQPAGGILSEDFHRAGGVPAAMVERAGACRLHPDRLAVTRHSVAASIAGCTRPMRHVIRPWDNLLARNAGRAVSKTRKIPAFSKAVPSLVTAATIVTTA